jgi:hypothetical protein
LADAGALEDLHSAVRCSSLDARSGRACDRRQPGTYVTYKRRPDYWAKDLAVNRGRFNFDELRYEYYRDRTL